MKLTVLVLSFFLAVVLWARSTSAQTQPKAEELAQRSAEAWLALTDSGKYGESWELASSAFKGAVSKDQWVGQLTSVRAPLGKVDSRKLNVAQHKTNPPNAPAGEYVVLAYSTGFENKNGTTETVAMVLDKDGKWRTTGYFIK